MGTLARGAAMSTASGDIAVANAAVAEARSLLAGAAAEEEQLDLLEPLTAAELDDVRQELGAGAGLVTVMRVARERRQGRPKGSRNKRTDDFARYIGQFGQDPAITLMQIQSTPTEELVARSRLLDLPKRQMSYADAESLRIRCAEALLPYIHSKKPVAIDATIRGVIVQETIGEIRDRAGATIDGEILGVAASDLGGDWDGSEP